MAVSGDGCNLLMGETAANQQTTAMHCLPINYSQDVR